MAGMNLFWLCYERDGQLAGIVIIRASALIIARLRAVLLRLEPALNFAKGYELDPDIAAEIPNNVIGRLLSPSEASKLAAAFEWRQRRGRTRTRGAMVRAKATAAVAWGATRR
jgi:hypothetical protein